MPKSATVLVSQRQKNAFWSLFDGQLFIKFDHWTIYLGVPTRFWCLWSEVCCDAQCCWTLCLLSTLRQPCLASWVSSDHSGHSGLLCKYEIKECKLSIIHIYFIYGSHFGVYAKQGRLIVVAAVIKCNVNKAIARRGRLLFATTFGSEDAQAVIDWQWLKNAELREFWAALHCDTDCVTRRCSLACGQARASWRRRPDTLKCPKLR